MRIFLSVSLACVWFLCPLAAHAVDPAVKCRTGKLKEAAKPSPHFRNSPIAVA